MVSESFAGDDHETLVVVIVVAVSVEMAAAMG
jgi:hypothetical protein